MKIKPRKKSHHSRRQILREPCDVCQKMDVARYECKTCESLVAAGKDYKIFTTRGCAEHIEVARSKMRQHAMLGHPVNIVRAAAAALRGESLE